MLHGYRKAVCVAAVVIVARVSSSTVADILSAAMVVASLLEVFKMATCLTATAVVVTAAVGVAAMTMGMAAMTMGMAAVAVAIAAVR